MDRKLKTEIDRALKNIAQGCEQFDEIYEKLSQADTSTKKEKGEVELKTQIKKLQRLRDQLKGWIASTEIREKDELLNARKIIEARMELFKKAEKEAKTKAFSKEGLAQGEKLDPEAAAKQACREWVDECLQQIREQRELVGADLESLQSKKGKKNKEELEEIQNKLKQHTFHVHNLELVLRGLDNDVLNYESVDELKDDVEYYVSNNNEVDFVNDESLYEPLDLEASLGTLGKEVIGEVITQTGIVAPAIPSANNLMGGGKDNNNNNNDEQDPAHAASGGGSKKPSQNDKKIKTPAVAGVVVVEKSAPPGTSSNTGSTIVQVVHTAATQNATSLSKEEKSNEVTVATAASGARRNNKNDTAQIGLAAPSGPSIQRTVSNSSSFAGGDSLRDNEEDGSIIAQQQYQAQQQQTYSQSVRKPTLASLLQSANSGGSNSNNALEVKQPISIPTSNVPTAWPKTLTIAERLAVFDASLQFIPTSVDSERSKLYVPQHPFSDVPASFPNSQAPILENPQFFSMLDLDALFFIFYHQPATYLQNLAALQLKKHSWRWNSQYKVWMQRYEDPTMQGADFEVGTFVYFDNVAWVQKVKTNFTFEYSKME